MSTAAIARVPREQELIAEVRAYLNGNGRVAPRDTHLVACIVAMDEARTTLASVETSLALSLDRNRLAAEAAEREKAELLEQLTAERARRIALEDEVEALDKMVGQLLMDASQLSTRSTAAKRMVAAPLYPQPAGSGGGVR